MNLRRDKQQLHRLNGVCLQKERTKERKQGREEEEGEICGMQFIFNPRCQKSAQLDSIRMVNSPTDVILD